MMKNGFICESAHIEELDPGLRRHGDRPRSGATMSSLRTVLSNSFGFGGTNGTLVFKQLDA